MHGESRWIPIRSTVLLLVTLIIASVFLYWSYIQYRSTSEDVVRVNTAPAQESDVPTIETQPHAVLLEKIGKFMDLPAEEVPEVSKVKDAEVLKESQSFFENVAQDDTLIVFKDFAVIYRESEDVIINSGKVSDDELPSDLIEEEVESDAPGADTTVEVRNGTVITGYAGRTKDKLVILAYTIAGVGNASKKTYTTPVIVTKNNVNSIAVKALEKMFNVTATIDLPEGEQASEADILVILGGAE